MLWLEKMFFSIKVKDLLSVNIKSVGFLKVKPSTYSPKVLMDLYDENKRRIFCCLKGPLTEINENSYISLSTVIDSDVILNPIDSFVSPYCQQLINKTIIVLIKYFLCNSSDCVIIRNISFNNYEFMMDFTSTKQFISKQIESAINSLFFINKDLQILKISSMNEYIYKIENITLRSYHPLFTNLSDIKSIKFHKWKAIYNKEEEMFEYSLFGTFMALDKTTQQLEKPFSPICHSDSLYSSKEFELFVKKLFNSKQVIFKDIKLNQLISKSVDSFIITTQIFSDNRTFLDLLSNAYKNFKSLICFQNNQIFAAKLFIECDLIKDQAFVDDLIQCVDQVLDNYQLITSYNQTSYSFILRLFTSIDDVKEILFDISIIKYPLKNNESIIKYSISKNFIQRIFQERTIKPLAISTRQIKFIPLDEISLDKSKSWLSFCNDVCRLDSCSIDVDFSKNFFYRLRKASDDLYNFFAIIGKKECESHKIELKKNIPLHVYRTIDKIGEKNSMTLNSEQLNIFIEEQLKNTT